MFFCGHSVDALNQYNVKRAGTQKLQIANTKHCQPSV